MTFRPSNEPGLGPDGLSCWTDSRTTPGQNPGRSSRECQSPVPNLQFPPVFPAHVPSRTLHHPANPLYSIIILSHPFSTLSHFPSHVLQPSYIHHCTTSLE